MNKNVKKIISLFCCLTVCITVCEAQNTFPSTGNVGIGTASPASALSVAGGGATLVSGLDNTMDRPSLSPQIIPGELRGLSVTHPTQDDGFLRLSAGGGTHVSEQSFIDLSGYTVSAAMDRYKNIIMGTDGQERLRINYEGNLGIGTKNPVAKLHINTPAADSTMSSLKFGVAADSGNLHVPLNASAGGYNIDFATWRDIAPDQIGARIRADRQNVYGAGNALIQAMDMVFYTSNGNDRTSLSERVRIKSNGRVGIGTDAPTQLLSVDGNINAKEVIVTTSGWPDYVFNEGYKLPSLETLSEQISKEGHLPGMPSAREVASNGQGLGDMNKKLLQKVEELTLYLIEEDKKVKSLEEENASLRKQQEAITGLEQRLDSLEQHLLSAKTTAKIN